MGSFTIYDILDGTPLWCGQGVQVQEVEPRDGPDEPHNKVAVPKKEVKKTKEKFKWLTQCTAVFPDRVYELKGDDHCTDVGSMVISDGKGDKMELNATGVLHGRQEGESLLLHTSNWKVFKKVGEKQGMADQRDLFECLWMASKAVTEGAQDSTITMREYKDDGFGLSDLSDDSFGYIPQNKEVRFSTRDGETKSARILEDATKNADKLRYIEYRSLELISEWKRAEEAKGRETKKGYAVQNLSSGAKRRRKPRVKTPAKGARGSAKTRTVATKKALKNLQGMGGVKRAVTGNRKVEDDMWKKEDRNGEKKRRVSARRYYERWGEAAIGDRVDIRGEGKEEDKKCLKVNSEGVPRWSRCHAPR